MPLADTSSRDPNGATCDRALGLCADVGGSFIKSARISTDGRLQAVALQPTPVGDWTRFSHALAALCRDLPADRPLSLSIAGVVDPDDGQAFSANVPCLTGRPVAAALSQTLGRPVLVANDAHCMALAEALRGAGVGHRVVFAIILGSGVGGGLVLEGRIVQGAGGVSGEWGHGPMLQTLALDRVAIPPQPCGCGQHGCLDTLGGAHGLERLHALVHGRSATSHAVCEGWATGDAEAVDTVQAWLSIVAGPLAVMINATGAGIVPVAGGLGNDAALVAALDGAVRARMLRRTTRPVVVPSRFGNDAGLLGAALRLEQSLGGSAAASTFLASDPSPP